MSDTSTRAVLTRFYEAFAARDHATMRSLYAPDATFSDPVFPALKGDEVGDMWQMLCERGADLSITFEVLEASERAGKVRWEAHYTFSQTKRKVHNIIEGTFTLQDGKITSHTDRFDLWRWSRQALGLPGVLLGWSPPIQNKVRNTAARSLSSFQRKR